MKRFKDFLACEDGAVTVDWVVLVALVVGLTTAGYLGMHDSIVGAVASLSGVLSGWTIGGG